MRAADEARRPRVPPNCDLTLGAVCVDKTEPGVTVWTMTPGEHMANPVGVVQGGFVAALTDTAMAASTITSLRGTKAFTANTELKISYIRPAKVGVRLSCTARVIGGGRRVRFVEAEVTDEDGSLVAKASSTFVLTPRD